MANSKDREELENMDSLDEMLGEEYSEEEEQGVEATDDFKALFDDSEEFESEDEDEDSAYLDGEPLSMDDANNLDLEDSEEDEDSLSLEESELADEELSLSEEDTEAEDESSKKNMSLSEAFEALTEDAEEDRLRLQALAEEENLAEALTADEGEDMNELSADGSLSEGSELGDFESPEIEEKEFVDADTVVSIVESVLFSTDKPIGIGYIKKAFEGTVVKTDQIRKAITALQIDYAGSTRGVTLEEVSGGYQLRTKVDNLDFLKRINKGRPFKLSGPALEVLSIVAYKQPLIKSEVDEIRGVESGHLMRALMDRSLIRFAGKSELPGKPMLYETTKKFLEIFSLRSLKELPSLSEIDELIPEGIGEEEEKPVLGDVTDSMSVEAAQNYSEGEEELIKIEDTLGKIDTTTEFFEQEKAREKARRDKERADGIREALDFNEEVDSKDKKWLARYDKKMEELRLQEEAEKEAAEKAEATSEAVEENLEAETLQADAAEEGSDALLAESDDEVPMDVSEDESSELFADAAGEEELVEEGEELSTTDVDKLEAASEDSDDESAELFTEEEVPEENAKDVALNSAFGDIGKALDAFESEDGISVDAEPEMEKQDTPESVDKDLEL